MGFVVCLVVSTSGVVGRDAFVVVVVVFVAVNTFGVFVVLVCVVVFVALSKVSTPFETFVVVSLNFFVFQFEIWVAVLVVAELNNLHSNTAHRPVLEADFASICFV